MTVYLVAVLYVVIGLGCVAALYDDLLSFFGSLVVGVLWPLTLIFLVSSKIFRWLSQ